MTIINTSNKSRIVWIFPQILSKWIAMELVEFCVCVVFFYSRCVVCVVVFAAVVVCILFIYVKISSRLADTFRYFRQCSRVIFVLCNCTGGHITSSILALDFKIVAKIDRNYFTEYRTLRCTMVNISFWMWLKQFS